jgi:hypothetical protein
VKVIKLTQGKEAIVDDSDFYNLNKYKWCAKKDTNTYYAMRKADLPNGKRTTILMHREILPLPQGLLVDHIDGNGLNNQRENLRPCTCMENTRNAVGKKNSTSMYKGVDWVSRDAVWRSSIRVKGRLIFLGNFDKEADAALAYNKAAIQHFGEFAKLNVIEEGV